MAAARLSAVVVAVAFLIYLSGMSDNLRSLVPEPIAEFFASNSDGPAPSELETLRSKAASAAAGAVTRRDARSRRPAAKFSLGDTKEKVRAAYGAPVTEAETVWLYPSVKVYFVNGRVIGWSERPGN